MKYSFGPGVRKLNPGICGVVEDPTRSRLGHSQERTIHDEIFDECRARRWIAFHGSMAARTHRTEGEPDFTILADHGRFFLIECKSRTGKRSPSQNAIAIHATKLGHTVHIVRTLEEFRAIVGD